MSEDTLDIDQMVELYMQLAKAGGMTRSRTEASIKVLRLLRSGAVPLYHPDGRPMELPAELRDAEWLDRL